LNVECAHDKAKLGCVAAWPAAKVSDVDCCYAAMQISTRVTGNSDMLTVQYKGSNVQ